MEKEPAISKCEWAKIEYDKHEEVWTYASGCAVSEYLILSECQFNDFKHCPYCGRELKEM